jgi:TetR/AcrR family transcriptional regulator, transcriptional repressor for nem operon
VRVSRRRARENREAVLATAARLFRERGLDGAGVAEIMREVGLTHGGFYGQFPGGKDALAAEAVVAAFAGTRALWKALTEGKEARDALAAIAGSYLSDQHRAQPGYGCPVPALAADVARRDGPARAAFTAGVRSLLDALAPCLPGAGEAERRASAARLLATLAGAVLLARAVDDPDLAAELLQGARTSVDAQPGAPDAAVSPAPPARGRASPAPAGRRS